MKVYGRVRFIMKRTLCFPGFLSASLLVLKRKPVAKVRCVCLALQQVFCKWHDFYEKLERKRGGVISSPWNLYEENIGCGG